MPRDADDDDELFRSLGKVVHNATQLEETVLVLVWELSGDKRVGHAMTPPQTSFGRLLEVAERLVQHRHPDAATSFKAWRKKAETVMRRRNDLVHSWWHSHPSLGRLRTKPLRATFTFAHSPSDWRQHHAVAAKLTAVRSELLALVEEFGLID